MALPLSKTVKHRKSLPSPEPSTIRFCSVVDFYLPLKKFPLLLNKFESALSLDQELYASRCESQSVTCPITALKYHGNLTPQLHPRHLESWPARHGLRATQCDHQRKHDRQQESWPFNDSFPLAWLSLFADASFQQMMNHGADFGLAVRWTMLLRL